MGYKVKINDLVPVISKEELYRNNCYLGISINNPFFLGNHLEILLKWIDKRFPNCKIIVGDHLHRINEYIINGREGQEAIDEAKKRGEIIAQRFRKELTAMKQCNFEFEYWETYYNNPDCQKEKQNLTLLYEQNKRFHASINKSCTEFIQRQINRGCHIQVSFDKAIELSREYLLEEMGVFNYLIQKGYKTQVYPGTQLFVLKDLALKNYPEINTFLSEGIYVDLTVRKV